MIRSLSRLAWALAFVCLAAPAQAQSYADEIDVEEIPEVDVLFKCHKDDQTPEAALYGLAHRLSRRRDRVYSVLMSPSESRFGYVSAPFAVSAPALFERDGNIYACVTVQSLASFEAYANDEVEQPSADAPDSVDDALDDAVDQAEAEDPNSDFDGNDIIDDPNAFDPGNDIIDDPNAFDPNGYDPNEVSPPAYEEEDDLRIPKGSSYDPLQQEAGASDTDVDADDSFSYLNPNNAADSPFFDEDDLAPLPPTLAPPGVEEPDVSPAPAPAPSADPTLVDPATATAPNASERDAVVAPPSDDTNTDPVPLDPTLPEELPGLPSAMPRSLVVPNASEEAVLDGQTDVLPPADSAHGPILHPHSAGELKGRLSDPVLHGLDDNASPEAGADEDAEEEAPESAAPVSRISSDPVANREEVQWPLMMSLLNGY